MNEFQFIEEVKKHLPEDYKAIIYWDDVQKVNIVKVITPPMVHTAHAMVGREMNQKYAETLARATVREIGKSIGEVRK